MPTANIPPGTLAAAPVTKNVPPPTATTMNAITANLVLIFPSLPRCTIADPNRSANVRTHDTRPPKRTPSRRVCNISSAKRARNVSGYRRSKRV
jgi:hypothetical protein